MRFNLLRRWVPGAMLLVAASTSFALTLGRAQGVALIGRPLELGIQIGLDSPSEANDLCTEAEVFYGEARVDARRVDLRSTASADTVAVRVRVSAPVDEAYVTVYLRVGCGQKLTRRYVLLSEQPGDIAEAVVQPMPVAPPVNSAGALAGGSAAGASPAGAGSPATAPRTRPVRAEAAVSTVPPAAAGEGATAARRAAPAPAATKPLAKPAPAPVAQERPRLKLDPVELRPGIAPAKAASTPADAPPAAPAVAEPSADELQRNAERIQSLEADLKALREGMLKRDAALTDLRDRLEKAELERYANGLVYGLGGLLAIALAAIVVLWRRGRHATTTWWDESRQPPASPTEDRLLEDPLVARAPAPAAPAPVAAARESGQDIVPPTPVSAPPAPALTPVAAVHQGRSEPLDPYSLRVSEPLPLTSDELSDIQQEADFFVSLGEYERAIEVLRNHIEAHPQASAVAWLDLLEIHHKLGRHDEYEQLRRDFEWLFNAKAPAFASFAEDSRGLEDYPRLLRRIQSVWPGPGAQQVIDDALFRRAGAEGDESLNLQAYRDLLFLHDVAAELVAEDGGGGADAARAGVDIDLDELHARAAADQAVPALAPQPVPIVTPTRPADARGLEFEVDPGAGYQLPSRRT